MPDSYTAENGTADHALFENQETWAREGYAVISGCEATAGSNDWEVDVTAGEVLVDGSPVTVDAQSVTLTAPTDNPRWDVLYVDPGAPTGSNVTALEGVEQAPDELEDGTRLTRLETRYPTPDDATDSARTIIAIVWVDPESGPLLSDTDVIDRRITATVTADAIDAQSATIANAPGASTDVIRKQELDALDLEDVRAVDNILAGDVDVAGNQLLNLAAITASGSAISLDSPIDGQDPTASTELTTKSYVDGVAQGLEYKESVLDELNTPPSSPADGDRYLVDDSPSGDWSGHPNEIAEYDGSSSSWTFTVPDEGWSIFVEDVDVLLVYNGTDWVQFGSTLDHGVLQGLADDDHTQYLHTDGRRAMAGTLDLADNDAENVGAVSETENVVADAGTAYDVDLANGGVHEITLTSNCDISLSGVDTGAANSVTLLIVQDGTGGHTLSFTTTVLWPDGSAPSIATGANEITRLVFTYVNGSWYGSKAGEAFA